MFWGLSAVIVTLLSLFSLKTGGQNIFEAQPRIVTQNGHLLLISGRDRNITLKTSSRGYVNLNGENLALLAKSAREAADSVQRIRTNVLTELERNVEELQTTVLGPQGLMGKLLTVERALRNTTSMSPSSSTPFGKRLNGLNRRVGMLERRVRQLQNLLTTNECAGNPCKNGGTCIDAYNGYICQCPRNWQGRTCNIDVNECAQFAGTDIGCQNGATCINRPGTYECVCAPNWFGVHCTQRTDDCSSSSAEELCGHGTCVNTKASGGKSYKCLCDQGWTTQAGTGPCIQDVDECSSQTRPACSTSPPVQCINVPGSFYCGPCPQGYTGNGYFCNDIDECQVNNGGCSQNPFVQCINTLGSRICGQCPPGYQGDGKVCNYLGVCAVSNGGCHPMARCIDNPRISQTYVECICPNGYVGSGMGPSGCVPSGSGGSVVPGGGPVSPNPCLNSRCVQGTCVSTSATAYRCLCHPGYTGNLCESPEDPCLSTPCQHGGSCVREGSSGFRCICATGFTGLNCQEEEQICGGTLTAMTGTLKFPSSGSVQYGHNLNCPWLIITNTSSVIQLNFTKFELEASTNCELDFLQIHDGRSSGAHMIGRFCGNQKPPNITSTHNKLYLWFRSDQTHAHGGFELTWNSTNPVCGNPFLRFQTHGTLQSPGSPGRYPNNRDCYWTLVAPYGRRIKFTFFTMQIEASANCSNDYLEIHSGWQTGNLVSRYCNTSHPRPVMINAHVATLYFHTNDRVNDAGFQISYTSEPGISDCGGTLTAPSGEITSPNHPTTYRENMNCEWHIQLPQNERIHITFLSFSLESSSGCYYDFVEIRTGVEQNAPVVGRYCGNNIPPQYTSSSNELVIVFISDYSVGGGGFRIRYEAFCGGEFSAPSGVVTSPYYPGSYPRNRQCRYEIALPVGMAVRLCFQFFDVEDTSSPPCRFDYLEIRDGHNENSTLMGRYCGGTSQFPTPCITSTYNYLWMKFKTDGSVQNQGFYANYTSINVGCGGVYKARTGTIQTPNYPLNYPHEHKCNWIIAGGRGTVVKLTWESFAVESSVGCMYDKVLVFDNSTVRGHGGLMGTFCGGQLPPVLITTDNTMTIIFKTDSSSTREGFSATYTLLDSSTLCGGTYYTTKGSIQSPNYPNWYPNSKDCTWVISVPTGQQIKLKILDFSMEGGNNCLYDFLEIRNGGTSHSPLIGKFCGTSITRSIPSFTNQMYLRFKSDSSGRRKGFKISWDGTTTGCGGILNAPSGSITSPNYPQPYGRSSECFWRISVSQGSLIQLVFVDLDLEGTTCAHDYLEVYDGVNIAAKRIGRYCSSTPLLLKSTDNHMYLKFRSDSSFEGRGFLLRYESVCNNIIKGYSGVIESPNFPTNYPNALDCTWNITAPRGNKINVTFSHFDIEPNSWWYRQNTPCTHDYVEVKEGRGSSAPDTVLMDRKCGSEIPEPVHSSKDHVYVHMLTDHSVSGRGFRLEWLVDGCGGVLRKPFGTIVSPNYPGSYPIETECEWLISVDWNHSIEMTIKNFSMENVPNCYYDSLTFYSGSDSSGPMLHQFCHSNTQEEIFHSSGNQMFVRFSTDNSIQGQGFFASYRQIDRKCGGKFTTPKGSFHTPNYPNVYDVNDECQWLIEVDQNHVVWLEFTDFDLSGSRNCNSTFVKIYDGNSTANGTLLFHNCSNNMPQVRNFTSTGNQLLVHFRSGANDYAAKGFMANFSIACGARISATDTGIISTNTGLSQAHNNNCSWVISAANPVDHVTLTINVLDVSPNRDAEDIRCPYYFIEVRDGDNAEAPLIGNYCGNRAPPHITSQGSTLFVHAVSLYGVHHGTFSATYSVLSSFCGGNLSSEHGSFASPSYPNSYPVEADCVWYINTSPGNRVMLTFSMFQLETSDFCNEDYLEVRENSGVGRVIGIYCGSDIPGNLTAAHNLWIKFRSSGSGTAPGFVADYSMLHGNELTGPSGQVASLMYPRPYIQGGEYYWRITVENGKAIAITFRDFFISGYHYPTNCHYNYIAIYDGFDATGPTLLKACGSDKPEPLTSSSNVVYIEFSTGPYRLGSYFLLDWLQVERQITSATPAPPTIPGCGGTISMEISPNHTNEVYDLKSPGFPDGYGSNLNCEWIFETTPVHHLSIYFQDMNLEESSNCFLDSVKVYTGEEGKPDWKLLSTQCLPNATYQRPIETSNLMKVVFKTDYYGNKTGFRAKIRIECGGFLTGPNGVIDMRNESRALRWQSRYSPLQCEWNVTVRSGKTIAVRFDRFSIPSQDRVHCGESSITLRNGISHTSPLLGRGRYCGNYFQDGRLETTGNHLFIKYKGLTSLAEFKLVYQEVSLACGGRYTLSKDTRSLIIKSPNYPNVPRPHTECEWVFMAPAGERIHVDFLERFDFTYSTECTLSFVELRDGGTISSDLIGKFCGQTPSSQYTTGNTLYVRYFTDATDPKSGFKANVSIDSCGGTFRGWQGRITPPNYPGQYPNNMNCTWRIIGSPDHFITIWFDDLSLPNNTNCTGKDSVSVSEMVTRNVSGFTGFHIPMRRWYYTRTRLQESTLAKYCENRLTATIPFNSTKNEVKVRFFSDSQSTASVYRGFSLRYKVSQDRCGGTIEGTSGVFQSPGYPSATTYRRFCQWEIVVPMGRRVKVEILDFDLESSMESYKHRLTFIDGSQYGFLIKNFYSHDRPETVRSLGNRMKVNFYSFHNVGHRGFKAHFSSDEPAVCGGTINDATGYLLPPARSLNISDYFCEWQRTVQSEDTNKTLVFTILNGTFSGNSLPPCTLRINMVGIYPKNDKFTTVAEFCGNYTTPSKIAVPFTDVTVIASKRSYYGDVDFTVMYSENNCGGILSGPVDTLSTPVGANGKYPPNTACTWSVDYPAGSVVNVTFISVKLDRNCDGDYLLIRNGPRYTSPKLIKCCSSTVPPPILSQSSKLWIEFHSDGSGEDQGVVLRLEPVFEGCGGVIQTKGSVLTSPKFPANYPSNAECSWEIRLADGYSVSLEFVERFDIEQSTGCTNDYLEVFDFVNNEYVSMGKYCDRRNHPQMINSTGPQMKVIFRSNGDVNAGGFKAVVGVNCGGIINKTSGRIISPGFPNKYDPNLKCNYTIIAPPGQKINLVFTEFSLEGGSYRCYSDWVKIYKENRWSRALQDLGKYCGTNAPPPMRTSERVVIEFRSDGYIESQGFMITYSTDSCGGVITTQGMIQSPSFQGVYHDGLNCLWNITAPVGKTITLRFSTFLLEYNARCYYDSVAVYDGNDVSNSTRLLGKLCGDQSQSPPILHSSSNKMVVWFRTDASGNYQGFTAAVIFQTECGGTIQAQTSATTLAPVSTSDLTISCTWLLLASRGQQIQISLTAFTPVRCSGNTTSANNSCSYVEVRDGPGHYSELIQRFDGNLPDPRPVLSSSANQMWVHYISDSGVNAGSFSASVTAVNSPCGSPLLNVTNTTQELTSPGYPGSYSPNIRCVWMLSTSDYHRFDLHFADFDIESSPTCTSDYLSIEGIRKPYGNVISEGLGQDRIYAGRAGVYTGIYHGSRNPITKTTYCGSKVPYDYYSDYTDVRLTFNTNGAVQKKGFKLRYAFTGCNRNYTGIQGRVFINSVSNNCILTIQAPLNRTISLYFSDFYVYSNNQCTDSSLVVRDGLTANSLSVARLCGYRLPNAIFSTGNSLRLEFTIGNNINPHMDATYTTTDQGRGCGGQLFNYGGTFTSPLYPNPYRNNSVCRWDVSTPLGTNPVIKFTAFDIGSRSTCTTDFVEIYDVNSDTNEETFIARYCGGDTPAMHEGTMTTISVRYTSSVHNGGTGWVARFLGKVPGSTVNNW